ncbi:serine/threonine-protein kinase KIN2 [Agyrium rufum]|nr:serine/threonine-protein kinase KIN2 [Agyrium rufum]
MSTATTASPTAVRSSSHDRSAVRNAAPVRDHHRRISSGAGRARDSSDQPRYIDPRQTSSPPRGTSMSQSQQAAPLAAVARRDYEQSNLARPQSSRRSSSKDRASDPVPPPTTRTDSTRSHRSNSKAGHQRYASDGTSAAAHAAGVAQIPAQPTGMVRQHGEGGQQAPSATLKRRTTINTQTGNWSLGKTIGAGSMGKVKLARNMETGEQVAIKIVPRQSTDEHVNQRDRERADHSKEIRTAREAAIVTLLNHPFICGMRDVVRTNYHWYMLFEYVNGGQMLDYIISHGRLKEKQARKFGRQIASALDYCHRNSIVHRDLKIENILISKTGDIKIIDFGLSNLFSPRSTLKTFCGSLYFAAPELLQARQYTGPEVDIWSFGIVLYVLVCGKVPFDDQSMPQLHAKIKKGVVDYPAWITPECKNLISRMLVTDPKQRATLTEIMNHAWMVKGFNVPPENYLPTREPLSLPLDPVIIDKMTGFDFGSPEFITRELTRVLESEEYQNAIRLYTREASSANFGGEKKRGVFDFYKRRGSINSRDTLPNASVEAIQFGLDPINAFSPLISIYYLVREKRDRELTETNPGALSMPKSPGEKPLKLPDLPAPEAAHTNNSAYEMAGEKTGGRSRARARTHGEDDVTDGIKRVNLNVPPTSPAIVTTPPPSQVAGRKESTASGIQNTASGLLRRFSTRRGKSSPRTPSETPAASPAVQVQPPAESPSSLRKSFSVRRPRKPMLHATGSQPQQSELLNPETAKASTPGGSSRGLGRSTSVNSGSSRYQSTRRPTTEAQPTPSVEPPPTSGSDRSSEAPPKTHARDESPQGERPAAQPRLPTSRAKSLGHNRRESMQVRRAQREASRQSGVPEETDQELEAAEETTDRGEANENSKPVFLKGLFSVSTTSSKPLPYIRADIVRVLKQLNVQYTEIRGGFSCKHAPSIDLNRLNDANPLSPDKQGFGNQGSHKRRISFGGFISGDNREREREELREHVQQHMAEKQSPPQRSGSRRRAPDTSFTNSEESDEDIQQLHRRAGGGGEVGSGAASRPAGETSTHVETDLGDSLVLKFEMLIVKVPLFSLHGIQFKKVAGGTWQYKNMAQKILDALRL